MPFQHKNKQRQGRGERADDEPGAELFRHPCRTRFGLPSVSQLGEKAAWQGLLKLIETLPVIARRLGNLLDC